MKKPVEIARDDNGVFHVQGRNLNDLLWGMGYVHATDRAMPMLLMRILGRGRASEFLDSSDATLEIDRFFRRMNWQSGTEAKPEAMPARTQSLCESYCEGVNTRLAEKIPWEFRLLGYRPDTWSVEDCFLMARMVGYLTLAQSQAEIERLFVEMVQAGVHRERLDALFPGILGGLDIDLLKQVRITDRLVPPGLKWSSPVPRMMASNNWVIAGSRTASGSPILANDPHLEVNRLPNVWYEIVLQTPDRFAIGASMPGLPGIVLGRNPDLAWGVTYTFMDAVDSWIERCKDGKYLREECGKPEWVAFRVRKEVIVRKKKPPVEVLFYENEHGVLDGNLHANGLYLSTRWSGTGLGARSIGAMLEMWDAGTVEDGRAAMGRVEVAFNWVFADRAGNIGYQMSGLLPRRRDGVSGFVPLPGWKKENDWRGFVDPHELPRALNPEEGFFVTANEDLNAYGTAKPINMPMAPYRSDRIRALLAANDKVTASDCFQMHYDVVSLQARQFMTILRPLLPATPQGELLRSWGFSYAPDSMGSFLFEEFYRALLSEVFGTRGMGTAVTSFLSQETGMFADFHLNFDRVLLSESSPWFGDEHRDDIFRRVAATALSVTPRTWGESQQVWMNNFMLGGKLPRWLGFDVGPVTIPGGRATIHQGQIYRSMGRTTSFVPSFRMVVEMEKTTVRTNMAGGPSDRRFSKWYRSDLENWKTGRYKELTIGSFSQLESVGYREKGAG